MIGVVKDVFKLTNSRLKLYWNSAHFDAKESMLMLCLKL